MALVCLLAVFGMGIAVGGGVEDPTNATLGYERVNETHGALHTANGTDYVPLAGEGGEAEYEPYGGLDEQLSELPGPRVDVSPMVAEMLHRTFQVSIPFANAGVRLGAAAPWWVPTQVIGMILSVGPFVGLAAYRFRKLRRGGEP